MQSKTIARRYAKSLLEAVAEVAPGSERAVGEELDLLVEAIEGHPALQLAAINPAIAASKKLAIFSKILEIVGGSAITHNFLGVLAEKQRLDHLTTIAAVYGEFVDEYLNVVTAQITTSTPLTSGQIADLTKSLSDATGREVQLSRNTDPSLLGGAVTRIGDVVYDGSVKGHLERIRQRLESS